MEFRKATPADLDAVMGMAKAAVEKGKKDGSSIWNDYYPTRDMFALRLSQDCLYVLEDEGALLATGTLLSSDDDDGIKAHWSEGPGRLLSLLCVAPDRQGKGIGGKMVSFLEEECVKSGCRYVRLLAALKNNAALRLYERMGYRAVGDISAFEGDYRCFEKDALLRAK